MDREQHSGGTFLESPQEDPVEKVTVFKELYIYKAFNPPLQHTENMYTFTGQFSLYNSELGNYIIRQLLQLSFQLLRWGKL